MSIQFVCTHCGATLRVPDHAAGMSLTCPECKASVRVPETAYPAEEVAPQAPAAAGQYPPTQDYGQAPGPEGLEGERRPCPMCGEMILTTAIKCRFCGEVFDEVLRRSEKHRGLPLASLGSRFGGALIDGVITLAAMMPGFLVLAGSVDHGVAGGVDQNRSLETAYGIMGMGLIVIVIIQTVLLSTRAQSIGKIAVGTRIVRYSDNSDVGFLRAVLLRWWVLAAIQFLIGLVIPYGGYMFALIDVLFIFGDERRCIHDLIADTKVVTV